MYITQMHLVFQSNAVVNWFLGEEDFFKMVPVWELCGLAKDIPLGGLVHNEQT